MQNPLLCYSIFTTNCLSWGYILKANDPNRICINSMKKTLLLEWPEDCSRGLLSQIKAIEKQSFRRASQAYGKPRWCTKAFAFIGKTPSRKSKIQAVRASSLSDASVSMHWTSSSRLWKIPVCYGGDFGPDLESCAASLGITPEKLIEKHTSFVYPVYGIGFLPGFLYLGDVPHEIQVASAFRTSVAGVSRKCWPGGAANGYLSAAIARGLATVGPNAG